ncbi:MAG: penicillin acylase family protein [Chitinophagales bacterium]
MGDKQLPRIAPILSPFTGYSVQVQQAEEKLATEIQKIDGLKAAVSIYYDEWQVPHINAGNELDLIYMQGYHTAKDRLWQMEFISYAAAGRLSEIVGNATLEFDRMQRRIGLPQAADENLTFILKDKKSAEILNAYTAGVNAYINQLEPRDYPIEYKLLDYAPEQWAPIKSVLLIKYMAKMLSSKEYDFEFTNALNQFGKEIIEVLYPNFPLVEDNDPVIPLSYKDSVIIKGEDTLRTSSNKEVYVSNEHEKAPPYLGSNNWAVDGENSVTGSPILCNDPHLQLQIPSIWYQMQLTAPGVNVYGVTIPGAPGIIIGFNENIAWGVTNGAMDVKDWYKIIYKDNSREFYNSGGQWVKTKKHIEEIKIKGQETLFDTLIYTEFGPVTYDRGFFQDKGTTPLALRWTALDYGNELKTFIQLNKAKSYAGYKAALKHYNCPSQNFVFASKSGDIALWQRGKLPIRRKDQGKFIQEADQLNSQWQGFIPFEDVPHVYNPKRGFVSSANQHATDSTYPYPYHGIYQYYRNRRINDILRSKEQFRIADMMQLQNDNYNLLAEEVMEWLLPYLDTIESPESEVIEQLKTWDYFNHAESKAAVAFEIFWNTLYELTWDELLKEDAGLTAPAFYYSNNFLKNHSSHPFIKNKAKNISNFEELILMAIQESDLAYSEFENENSKVRWDQYKGTKARHWARIEPLHSQPLMNGGNKHIVNATSGTHGPSWRMIVALGDEIEAYGIYPGGQSGNPASRYYDNYSPLWEKGKYIELKFITRAEQVDKWKMETVNYYPAKN